MNTTLTRQYSHIRHETIRGLSSSGGKAKKVELNNVAVTVPGKKIVVAQTIMRMSLLSRCARKGDGLHRGVVLVADLGDAMGILGHVVVEAFIPLSD
ncbi:hypothetical protein J7T55_011617 [Diaporthe amygdali]|uniref:uncharacterized protein n=1 Tax=Phomopsis amygdali TaxID=1214568 RepID=UPI0022FDE8DC|nr:uncharacterized protein J7T55_011617 [Diaporthe amygdali]KAJ0123153.1 hypothetical protein J7T55_011617 [Diaporthe amygdali]